MLLSLLIPAMPPKKRWDDQNKRKHDKSKCHECCEHCEKKKQDKKKCEEKKGRKRRHESDSDSGSDSSATRKRKEAMAHKGQCLNL